VALDIRIDLARESLFQFLVGNASGKLDLLHATLPPLRVILLLARRLMQDPISIKLGETLLALFNGSVWWETTHSGGLGRLEACVCLQGVIMYETCLVGNV
jgi:hypothetical protein